MNKLVEEIIRKNCHIREAEGLDIVFSSITTVEKAMKEYAAKFINLAAEEAEVKVETTFDENERPWSQTIVDKESILKLKELL